MSQENGTWIKLELAVPPELADALSNFLVELGAEGVFQEERVSPTGELTGETFGGGTDRIPGQEEDPAPERGGPRSPRELLQAYIRDDELARNRISSVRNYLKGLSALFPDLEPAALSTETVTDPGWGEEWKKYFKPFRAGRRIVIKPTWEPYLACDNDIVVEIDPGMAFGTGQHPSTLMCLEAIEDILEADPAVDRVLDVGTGTGILGIAAAKLGAKKAVCIDIDEKAVKIARENAIINRMAEHLEIREGTPSSVLGSFDLVVANITSGPLIGMRADFLQRLRPGGCLVISGILEQDKGEMERHFLDRPLRLHRLRREKEWLCYSLRKEEERH